MNFTDENTRPPTISLSLLKEFGRVSRSNSIDSTYSRRSSGAAAAPRSPTDSLLSPCSKRLVINRTHSKESEIVPENTHSRLLREAVPHNLPFPIADMDFILGTSSKSRKAVIDLLGWHYRQMSPDIDEKAIRSPDPFDLPILIAEAKADKIMKMLKEEEAIGAKIIITADQIVLFDNNIREKPIDEMEAKQFLVSYSNNKVSTVSAVVATHYPSGVQCSNIDTATVYWKGIPYETINKVIAKGEIYATAGGFRVEDSDLNPLIASIEGTVDSILGMPVKLMVNLISEVVSYLVTDEDELENGSLLEGVEHISVEDEASPIDSSESNTSATTTTKEASN